jgi:hypothetical protein
MKPEDKTPATKKQWWALVRKDLDEWNSKAHPEDRMGIQDWIGEVGPNIHGWIAFRDRYGDWDASLSGFPDDEDDDY